MQTSRQLITRFTFLWLLTWFLSYQIRAGDWSQFRGSNGSGVVKTRDLPIQFNAEKNLIWRIAAPRGHSSPVLSQNRIFLSGFKEKRLLVVCLDRANGDVLWQKEVPRKRSQAMHKDNSPASPTPVTDGSNVYAFFSEFGLISFGPEGQERWRLPLGPFNNPLGLGASPILAEGKVLMLCDQENGSFFVAVDQEEGSVVWRVKRPEFTRGYATPILYQPQENELQVLVSGSHQLTAYSVEDGREIWWIRGLAWQMKSTPVMSQEVLYVHGMSGGGDEGQQEQVVSFSDVIAEWDSDEDQRLSEKEIAKIQVKWGFTRLDLDQSGFVEARDWRNYRARRSAQNGVLGIRLGGRGDMTDTNLLWRYRKSLPNVPSPLLYEGVLYLLKEGGILTALDASTGKVYKQGRLRDALGNYYASPVAGDGKIFTVSHQGKISVIQPGPDWKVLSVNDLGNECSATPAIAEGRLYIRSRDHLYCFGKQDELNEAFEAKKGKERL